MTLNCITMSKPITQAQKEKVRKRLTFDDHEPRSATPPTEPLPSTPPPNEINILNFSQLTEQQKMEQMLRWNFDFENEVPLNGDWEWERVSPPSRTVGHKEVVRNLKIDDEEPRKV